MIKLRCVCAISGYFFMSVAFSGDMGAAGDAKTQKDYLKNFSLQAMYNYNNFKFNSTATDSYNKFQGHTNLYLIGGYDTEIRKNMSGGVYFYNSQTNLTSELLLNPSSLVSTTGSIQSNSVIAHLEQEAKPSWFIEEVGGYGQNSFAYQTVLGPNTSTANTGDAKAQGNNWFVMLGGKYVHSGNRITTKAGLSLLYAQITQGAFSYFFSPTSPTYVPELVNKSTYLLENVEFTYKASEKIQPFFNAGLLEVLQFSNSRPLINDSVIVASSPEFNLNQNGFRVGAGLSMVYKKATLRLEQQYDQRGSVFHTNQSIVGLTLAL